MKTVSIIIPAKNEAEYLGECLASLSELDFPKERYEVIVADNGSDDNTVSIAEKYSAKVVDLPDEQTISAVRNGGVVEAFGDILVFLDADCTVSIDWLLCAEPYFQREDVSCFGSSPIIPEKATWVEKTWFLVRKSEQQVFERQWQESTNMFISKEIFNKAGGFNEKLATCEDVDLSYRLLKLGKIISDSRIAAIHHRDPKTIKEFFLKEKWRGKSNYSGLFQHGVKLSELPSLLLPLYFSGLLFIAIGTLLFGPSLAVSLVFFIMAQLPILGLTWLKIRKSFSIRKYFQLLWLYNVYFLARASAIFNSIIK
jgi:glycosyltransferase involved in cell wall biosynthesis